MGYYIDLTRISIDEFKDILRSIELIPSWKILVENIDDNFDLIKNLNDEKKIYNAHIGEGDMKMVIDSAKMPNVEVEY